MMRNIALACLAIGISWGLASAAQAQDKPEKKVIAVGEPHTTERTGPCRSMPRRFGKTLAKSLRTRIAQTGAYRVVGRSQIVKIIKEQELGLWGLTDPNKVKEFGKILNADYMLGIEMLCMPNHAEINVNLWSVEEGDSKFAKTYEVKNLSNTSRVLRDLAKMLKKAARSGDFTGSSRGEVWAMVDSKAFHDATDYMLDRIRYTIPKAVGEIEDVNVYGEELKVKIKYSGYKPWAGLKLKVTRDDEELGWVYLKKSGRGVMQAGTNDDMSSFEQGDMISSVEFEPMVAIGFIEDVDADREEMVEGFKERLYEIMDQADGVQPAEGRKVTKILNKMGKRTRKKDLAKLHKAGVDLLIVGRFLGERGKRRLDFEVLSTFNGKKVIDIKRDRIGL